MPQSLKDKVVLITGASSGFGASAAILFAREGAKVILAARRLDRLQELVNEIQGQGNEALALQVDIANLAEIKLMVQSALDHYGQINILFNNAGFGRMDWFENLDFDHDIESQINVNLTGLIHVTRAVLPHMIERGQGHIINMSSVAGWTAAPLYTVYAATKFGVRGFTDALRREVRPLGIHVSAIYPGSAQTEFKNQISENSIKKKFKTPARLSMTSEFVAAKVIQVAKRPRRALILPWWMRIVIWINNHFPGLSDWAQIRFSKKYHKK